MNINYIFDKQGTKAHDLNLPYTLWLDNGNDINTRIFDNHNKSGYNSTLAIIYKEKELVEKSLNELKNNNDICIHIHERPDIDCLFSAYYFEKLLNNQTVPDAILEKLVNYVEDIDAGKNKYISVLTFYALYCYSDKDEVLAKYNVDKNNSLEVYNHIKNYVFYYLDKLIDLLKEKSDFNIFKDSFPCIDEDKKELYDGFLKKQRDAYDDEYNSNALTINPIYMHDEKGNIKEVSAAIWNRVPKDGESCYLLARELHNAEVTFVPQPNKTYDAIISVPNDSKISLLNFAKECEIWEQYFDCINYKQTNEHRRNYYDSRQSNFESIFHQTPFRETNDPWYIGADYHIAQCPRVGSLLSYDKMIFILKNQTNKIQNLSIHTYNKEKDNKEKDNKEKDNKEKDNKENHNKEKHNKEKYEINNTEYFSCLEEVKKYIDNNHSGEIPTVMVNAKAQISEFGYAMIDYFFAYINKCSIYDLNQDNILHVNANLSIYISQKVILVFNTIRKFDHEYFNTDLIADELCNISHIRKACLDLCANKENDSIISLNELKKEIQRIQNEINNIQQLNDNNIYALTSFTKERLYIDSLINSILDDINLTYNDKRDNFFELFKPVSLFLAFIGYINTVSAFTGLNYDDLEKIGSVIEGTEEIYTIINFLSDNWIKLLIFVIPLLIIDIYFVIRKIKKEKIKKNS